MRIVITGTTGFIGSNLARVFLEQRAHAYALVCPGSLHLDAFSVHERLCTAAYDLVHVLECVSRVRQTDGFFHMAWGGVNRGEIDLPEAQARNVADSLDCVEAAGRLGCRVLMDAGSRVEYGAADGIMEEEAPCRPINEYGKAKWEFYQKAAPLCGRLGLPYYHLRFFSVYSCGDHPWSTISTLVRDLRQDKKVSLSACRHMWNFMYIEDAVQAVYELYRQAVVGGQDWKKDGFGGPVSAIVNIVSRDTRPLRSFVEKTHEIVGLKGTLEYGTFTQAKEGALSIRPDITRSKRLTDGRREERYTFRQDIEETIEKEAQKDMEKISVLIPCYSEAENVGPISRAVTEILEKELPRYDYEPVFIDNDSTDGTRDIVRNLCADNPHIKAILNARNFGQFNPPYYGMLQVTGDYVTEVVADSQDSVETIPKYIHEWGKGYKTVIGIKTSSKENHLMYRLRSCYYKTIKKLSDAEQIEHFTGSGLYDREFIEVLRSLDDPTSFLRGVVIELGYRRKEIPYEQSCRRADKTHNNFYRLYDAAMLSATSYTKVGLRLAMISGSICAVVSMITALVYLVMKLIWWDRFSTGMVPMLIGMLFLGSVQLFFIDFLGEYITSTNQRVMKHLLVIEEERTNLNEEEKEGGNEA